MSFAGRNQPLISWTSCGCLDRVIFVLAASGGG
jgi:hypothetical protein